MVNAFVQILFNVAIIVIFGWPMLRFLVYSIYLAGGLHRRAGHFLKRTLSLRTDRESTGHIFRIMGLSIFSVECGLPC